MEEKQERESEIIFPSDIKEETSNLPLIPKNKKSNFYKFGNYLIISLLIGIFLLILGLLIFSNNKDTYIEEYNPPIEFCESYLSSKWYQKTKIDWKNCEEITTRGINLNGVGN